MIALKIGFALLILMSALIAGSIPFRRATPCSHELDYPMFQALAAGIFLGAGLIHMLSDANEIFDRSLPHLHYPMAFLICGAVFLFLLLIEHLGREAQHNKHSVSHLWVVLAVTLLALHSLLSGITLGWTNTYENVTLLFVAIIAHKWAAAFALSVQINRSALSKNVKWIYFILFSCMTPLGIIIGTYSHLYFSDDNILKAIFFSLGAGTFLYIGTLHGLQQAVMVNQCCNKKDYMYVILGFSIMALVAIGT